MPLYLLGTLYFGLIWLLLFAYKGNRKEQLIASILGAFLGPLVQIMHLEDWWNPTFFCSDCVIKIEDVLFGFFVAGSITVIYNDIFIRKEKKFRFSWKNFLYGTFILALTFIVLFVPYYFFEWSSFITSLLAGITLFTGIVVYKPHLWKNLLFSGLIAVIICIPFYLLGFLINPDWIQQEWLTQYLSGITIIKIPIEEFLWYFALGISASAFWELLSEES